MPRSRGTLCGAPSLALTLLFLSGLCGVQARIAFTSVPATVQTGQFYIITWGGGDGSPVTITLKKGDPNDVSTVEVLAHGMTGSNYSWEVDNDLESASDYALQIADDTGINYSGLFLVVNSNPTSSDSSESDRPTSSGTTISSSSSAVTATSHTTPNTSEASQPSPPTSNPPSTTPGASSVDSASKGESQPSATALPAGAIVGIVIGAVIAVAMAAIAMVLFLRQRQRNRAPAETHTPTALQATETYPDMGELSAGYKANRHELRGHDIDTWQQLTVHTKSDEGKEGAWNYLDTRAGINE